MLTGSDETTSSQLEIGDVLNDRLVTFDAKTTTFTEYFIANNPNYPLCK